MFTNRLSSGLYFQSRFYAKALKRQVVRILTVEESEEFHQKRYTDTQKHRKKALDSDHGSVSTQQGRGISRASAVAAISSNKSNTSLPTFEKLLSGDRRFGPVITEAKLEYGRQKNGLILLEGKRLLLEAVQTNQKLKTVFFTNYEVLSGLPIEALMANGVAFYQVAANHMKVWSDTVASQGIMAVCKLPCTSEAKSSENSAPVTLICDGIKDAGSLGTLIRSAAAACCCSVLVTEGCVDVWEPKVLRASAGAHFHAQSLVTKVQWNMIKNYLTSNTAVYVVARPRTRPVGNRANVASTVVREEKHSVESLTAGNSTGRQSVPVDLPTVSVDALNVKNSNVAVIVSESLSSEARQLVTEANGHWIQFPSHDVIDAFNLPLAGSIALFETLRHTSVSRDCTD